MTYPTVDVAIVGGGIIGLAQAWEAGRRGLSVVLFERDVTVSRIDPKFRNGLAYRQLAPELTRDRALRSRNRWS